MDYILLGGDGRMTALAALLRRRGLDARCLEDPTLATMLLPRAGTVVTYCPPKIELSLEAVLALMPEDATVCLCGPGHSAIDPRIVDLWADEALKRENAMLTAEGALFAAMRASRRSLRALNCLVIGWGRIGGGLTELLVGLGVRVTVCSRSEAHRNRAIQRGADAVPPEALPGVLPKCDLVFSTPPAPVLDRALLERLPKEAMVIDLASPPYGVDLHAAWQLGLRAWREPGVPGRYCPESAAEALLRAMERGHAL